MDGGNDGQIYRRNKRYDRRKAHAEIGNTPSWISMADSDATRREKIIYRTFLVAKQKCMIDNRKRIWRWIETNYKVPRELREKTFLTRKRFDRRAKSSFARSIYSRDYPLARKLLLATIREVIKQIDGYEQEDLDEQVRSIYHDIPRGGRSKSIDEDNISDDVKEVITKLNKYSKPDEPAYTLELEFDSKATKRHQQQAIDAIAELHLLMHGTIPKFEIHSESQKEQESDRNDHSGQSGMGEA